MFTWHRRATLMMFEGTSLYLIKRAVIVTLMTTAGVFVKTLIGNKVSKKAPEKVLSCNYYLFL